MFPMASAEARELFKAGQRLGILSRQVGAGDDTGINS